MYNIDITKKKKKNVQCASSVTAVEGSRALLAVYGVAK